MSVTSARGQSGDAQAALEKSPLYALRKLKVKQVSDGLLITGRVATFYQKQQAQEIVRAAVRDAHLLNQIEVT